jgi:competence protein ComEC
VTSAAAYPALALVIGASCGGLLDPPDDLLRVLLALTCVAAVVGWRRHRPPGTLAAMVAGFFCAGVLLGAHARDEALESSLRRVLDAEFGGFGVDGVGPEGDHDPVLTRGILLEDAAARDGYVSLRLRATAVELRSRWLPVGGGLTVSISGEAAAGRTGEWSAGRTIEAPVSFRRPARYLNDGVADFERDLALGGTTLLGSVKSALLVQVLARGSVVEEWAADVRVCVRRAIDRWVTIYDAVAGAIVTAVLIGDRTALPDRVRERLQEAGTYHVIAISGGNIATLAAIVFGLMTIVGLHGRAAALIGIFVLLLYAQVTVAGPSVWRATLMAILYLTARVLDHRTAVWQAASTAAALMIVARPLDLRDPGFVLTFGATIALIEGARRASRIVPAHRIRAWVFGSVIASLAVELALLPVAAQLFSRVTSAGLLLNLIAVPMMGIAQVAGLVVVAFDSVSVGGGVAGWIAYVAADTLVGSARLVDVAPWLTARVPPPGVTVVLTYYVALAMALFGRSVVARSTGTIALVVAFACMVGPSPVGLIRSEAAALRLTMFDVGQGEALLVESRDEALQIDAGGAPFGGGNFDVGARVLAPALWFSGIRRIDTLLLTHGDPDHVGGAALLVEEFGVRRLWEGVEVPRHEPSRAIRELAEARGARREVRRAGEAFPWGDATLRVLHPPEPDWERPRIRNDDSVVLELRHGEVAVLLTGDIGADVERAIVPHLKPARVRILKVGHHGSRTSTSQALLDAWQPQIALISAGRGNTFGHPAPDVLQRLEAIGARIYRTDRHGQITLESDGREVTVRTYIERAFTGS